LAEQPIDQYAITKGRTECLAETLVEPARHLQRFVEQVAFLPGGGQQWTRTLQTRIPETAPRGRSWHIVSLGQYNRRRFPDFVASDASGTRLNLLTRQQHGIALTRVTTLRHIYSLPEKYHARLKEDHVLKIYHEFRGALCDFYITSGDSTDPKAQVREITRRYRHILICIGIEPTDGRGYIESFVDDLAQAASATRYLCWVGAEPNDVVSIRVLYTVRDANRELIRKELWGSVTKLRRGINPKKSDERKEIWADWYRQFGLAPLNYFFDAPSRRTASYYFSIDPPKASDVTYLDWEISNSLEDQEIDSAFYSAHIHNGDEKTAIVPAEGGTIRAFIRCAPHHHKQIIGVSLFNLVLVFLLAKGLLLGQLTNSAQSVLLAAPPILIAYLVRQQRHYYAHTLRLQRLIFWLYLAVSLAFLLTVAFSHKALGNQNPNVLDTFIGLLLAGSSLGVLVWYLPLGYSYQNIVAEMAKRKRLNLLAEASQRLHVEVLSLWQCYVDAVHTYCTRIFRTAAATMIIGTAVLGVTWHWLKHHDQSSPKHSTPTIQDTDGTLTTTWPSAACKDCNVNLRFVPSNEPRR
jgi:hypothetical protein